MPGGDVSEESGIESGEDFMDDSDYAADELPPPSPRNGSTEPLPCRVPLDGTHDHHRMVDLDALAGQTTAGALLDHERRASDGGVRQVPRAYVCGAACSI
jgi:hypothetical protein